MELKETEKRLLEAVSRVIEDEGFTKIGINRIARQAQCDKVLIYRYFGGLDGLLVAWAKQYYQSDRTSRNIQSWGDNKSGIVETTGILERQPAYAGVICMGIIGKFIIPGNTGRT